MLDPGENGQGPERKSPKARNDLKFQKTNLKSQTMSNVQKLKYETLKSRFEFPVSKLEFVCDLFFVIWNFLRTNSSS
jgi:hypothetical protein